MNELIALNVFTFIILLGIISLLKHTLRASKSTQKKIVTTVSIVLLSINVIKLLTIDGFIPVEFSTVSYYLVPIIILLRLKRLEVFAVYAGLMAGFFYYLTMLLQGGAIYNLYTPINIYTSLLCHGSLLFLGLYKLKTNSYNPKESYKLIIGVLLIGGWALYMRQYLVLNERLFIYELLDGVLIQNMFNDYNGFYYVIYYLILGFLVYQSTNMLFLINRKINPYYEEQLTAKQLYKNTIQVLVQDFAHTVSKH